MPPKRKELQFPIESIEFARKDLDFMWDRLHDVIAHSIEDFGQTAQFTLTLDLQIHRRHPQPRTQPSS